MGTLFAMAIGISGCRIEVVDYVCGDGFRDPGETCDDGNNINGDGCSASCRIETACGDGILDLGEGCDDGNNVGGDGCSAACTIEALCGDGYLDSGEGCDDGNNIGGDGCSAGCMTEAYCGDGYLDPAESCDDGNNIDADGCSALCQIETSEYLACNAATDCLAPDTCYDIIITAEATDGSMCTLVCSTDADCLSANGFTGACYSISGTTPLCFQRCDMDSDCFAGTVCISVTLPGGAVDGVCVPDNA